MVQRQSVFKVEYISDHSCENYRIGEIDSHCDYEINKYLKDHGEYGYQELINFFVRSIASTQNQMYNLRVQGHFAACQGGK